MENIDQYRAKLQAEHERLVLEMEENSKPQDFGSDVEGMDEEADEGEALANRLAIVQSLKDELGEVEDALHRIESGTYGVCTQCGKPISKEVLAAAPESALCEDCKKAL
jgi:RNA polymerase-binding transcription factor DksA